MGLFDSVSVVMDAVDDSAEETDVVVTLKEKNWYALRIGSTTSVGAGDLLRFVGAFTGLLSVESWVQRGAYGSLTQAFVPMVLTSVGGTKYNRKTQRRYQDHRGANVFRT